MDLSKREKGLVIGAAAVVALLAADYYVLTPLFDHQDQLLVQRQQILADIGRGQKLHAERKQLAPKWSAMISSGLKNDPAEAEGQLLHALRNWAKETGVNVSSVKPDRPESKEMLKQIHIQATGTGSMDGISKFLWKMQSAPFPLKVMELQLGSRNDSSSELALQLRVSTLYRTSEQPAAKLEKTSGGAR